jgi:hypothetical protein
MKQILPFNLANTYACCKEVNMWITHVCFTQLTCQLGNKYHYILADMS